VQVLFRVEAGCGVYYSYLFLLYVLFIYLCRLFRVETGSGVWALMAGESLGLSVED
jgi:hypothetical protein